MKHNSILTALLVATALVGVRYAPSNLLSTGSVTETVFENCSAE
jgi:hypothetical protein